MPLTNFSELDLPPLPASQVRLLQLLPKADVELAELVSIVETDPALTVAVLRAANSAVSSPVRRIGTARAAVIRLGALATRRLLGGYVVSSGFEVPAASAIDLDEYWRHSLATVLLADAIAIKDGGRTEAFTAGLLHDVGCLAMAVAEPERYSRVVQLTRRGVSEQEAERTMFGYDHAYYGERLAERWDLPTLVIDAIADSRRGRANEVAHATMRARGIAQRIGIGDGRGKQPGQLGLEPADHSVIRVVRGVEGLFSQIASFRDGMSEKAMQFGASGFVTIPV